MNFGALALVGSGEYTESMLELESMLLKAASARGKNGNYVQIATAAGDESDSRVEYWKNLGQEQADRLGVPARFLDIRNREDVLSKDWSQEISGASLIYFSGGNPHHLADSFRQTPLWQSVINEFSQGTSLAGCSAGAMFLGTHIPSFRGPFAHAVKGMNLIPGLNVLPHYDRYFGRIPRPVRGFIEKDRGDSYTIGIDENTALYYFENGWKHFGRGRIHQLSEDPHIITETSGADLHLPLSIQLS